MHVRTQFLAAADLDGVGGVVHAVFALANLAAVRDTHNSAKVIAFVDDSARIQGHLRGCKSRGQQNYE